MRTILVNRLLAGMLVTVTLTAATLKAAEVFLRADTTTLRMPDGTTVAMWGFAKDSAFGAMDGIVTVPGPTLTVMPGDPVLTIHLDNNLPEPVSLVIPGQAIVPSPVRMGNGRARSFTTETPPANGAPVTYTWNNLRPGTFLYQSGSHPAVQIQMGLYGCVRKDYAYGQTYPGVIFNTEVTLFYSEIDPALHHAVATGNYGPGQAMTSTVDFAPKYFLINGQSYTNGLAPVQAGNPGDAVMLHFLNAGLETHVPIVNNAYLRLIAEDGFQYPYPKDQYSVFLTACKTIDALVTFSTSGVLAIYDRRLNMMDTQVAVTNTINVLAAHNRQPAVAAAPSPPGGGMLTYLRVTDHQSPTNVPRSWVIQYFGAGPVYPPNTVGATDDPDHDGYDNLAEYIAGTDPTNALSALKITTFSVPAAGNAGPVVFEPTAVGRYYGLEFRTNLLTGAWTPVYTKVPGYPGSMQLTDPRSLGSAGFYRINVDLNP